MLGAASKVGAGDEIRLIGVNGFTGIGLYRENDLTGVISLTVLAGRITRVDIVRAPGKLGRKPGTTSR